jgi:Flp pilus assembly protein protease CpaA
MATGVGVSTAELFWMTGLSAGDTKLVAASRVGASTMELFWALAFHTIACGGIGGTLACVIAKSTKLKITAALAVPPTAQATNETNRVRPESRFNCIIDPSSSALSAFVVD